MGGEAAVGCASELSNRVRDSVRTEQPPIAASLNRFRVPGRSSPLKLFKGGGGALWLGVGSFVNRRSAEL